MSRRAAFVWGCAVALALTAANASAQPAAATGAGWPCDGEPQPSLHVGDYWPGAAPTGSVNWRDVPEVAALVETVAPRSVPLDDAIARVRAFAAEARPGSVKLAAAGLADSIDAERRQIVAGIRRFNRRQQDIAHHIQESYAELDKPAPPATDSTATQARAASEEQGRWFTKVFEDRQRMLPLICRQPEVLQARLKALVEAARDAHTKA